MADLIVDFPPRQRKLRAVRFADTAQMYIVERHEDYGEKNNSNVARHELWYTNAEYYSMKHAIKQDVLHVRAKTLTGATFNYAGAEANESSICCIGIEHLLTPACTLEVKACRARCTGAVLAEQERQGPSTRLRWENIALASFAQTKKVAVRARVLGKLHHDSI